MNGRPRPFTVLQTLHDISTNISFVSFKRMGNEHLSLRVCSSQLVNSGKIYEAIYASGRQYSAYQKGNTCLKDDVDIYDLMKQSSIIPDTGCH